MVAGEVGGDEAARDRVADPSSCSAIDRPPIMPPINWLRASSGLITRPTANMPSNRRTRTSPVATSTVTSANTAL
ncbi:hypothetical protein [Thermocatellispora tengchongensis]|uniref:hypothetical protein n=1 Tax=Thermocatellispora tengchongensis TaxID=1073253 RepID=UPI003635288F